MDDGFRDDLREIADRASNDLETQMQEIREDLAKLRETVGGLVSKGSSVLSAQLATARDRVKERANSWMQSGQEVAGQTFDMAKEREAEFEEVVQLHPIIAIVAALGVGAFLGATITSGTRRY